MESDEIPEPGAREAFQPATPEQALLAMRDKIGELAASREADLEWMRETQREIEALRARVVQFERLGDEIGRLRELARKWISQARHPQYAKMPEVRAAKEKCAADLQEALAGLRKLLEDQ